MDFSRVPKGVNLYTDRQILSLLPPSLPTPSPLPSLLLPSLKQSYVDQASLGSYVAKDDPVASLSQVPRLQMCHTSRVHEITRVSCLCDKYLSPATYPGPILYCLIAMSGKAKTSNSLIYLTQEYLKWSFNM